MGGGTGLADLATAGPMIAVRMVPEKPTDAISEILNSQTFLCFMRIIRSLAIGYL